jgi:flagellar biosynthesis/type III secretory pathway M-ring protein FliF/YscJ
MTLLAAAPALPLHKAGPYVAAAYIVFVALILIYVAIMAIRLSRTERDLAQLKRDAIGRQRDAAAESESERDPETVA